MKISFIKHVSSRKIISTLKRMNWRNLFKDVYFSSSSINENDQGKESGDAFQQVIHQKKNAEVREYFQNERN